MFKNKIVIVTGSGSGIGKSIAKMFSEKAAIVCTTDLDLKSAKKTSEECINKSYFFKLDVTKKSEVKEVFNQISKTIGNYEILISNAGISTMNNIENLTEKEWDSNINVNAKGVFLTNQEAIIHFKKLT